MTYEVKDYDTAKALALAGIKEPTQLELAVLDRFLVIHRGDVQRAATALRAYLAAQA